jgi:hypothetical protein
MGQRTLAFTKQMLRVFDFVELVDFDLLVAEAWLSIPRSSETNRDLIATRSEGEQAQANIYIYIYIRTLHHSNKNIIKYTERNRARYCGHARKRNTIVGATVEKLARLR